MALVVEYLPLAFGAALILTALFLILRRKLDSNVMPMLLVGAAFIFIADKGISNLKFGANGVEVSRKDLAQAKEDNTAALARIDLQVVEQKKLLDEARAAVANLAKSIEERGSRSVPQDVVTRLSSPDTRANSDFADNSKYSVLVFYRQGQRAAADEISRGMLAAGFQSAAMATDLSEVVSELGGTAQAGTIVVAAKDPKASFLGRIKGIVQGVADKFQRKDVRFDADDWSFRRGDVQIYLF